MSVRVQPAMAISPFWVALSWHNKQILPVATPSERDGTAVRRAAGRFTTVHPRRTHNRVARYADVPGLPRRERCQGWPGSFANLYQVTPVIVTPMADAADVLRDPTSHCLIYLGHADEITVLYDADAGA